MRKTVSTSLNTEEKLDKEILKFLDTVNRSDWLRQAIYLYFTLQKSGIAIHSMTETTTQEKKNPLSFQDHRTDFPESNSFLEGLRTGALDFMD